MNKVNENNAVKSYCPRCPFYKKCELVALNYDEVTKYTQCQHYKATDEVLQILSQANVKQATATVI